MNEQHLNKDLRKYPKADIINLLEKEGALYAGDILKKIGLSSSIGMRHILELKNYGMIQNVEENAKFKVSDSYKDYLKNPDQESEKQ